jgi:hypothetical protein
MEVEDAGKMGNRGRVRGRSERNSEGHDLEAVPRTSRDKE